MMGNFLAPLFLKVMAGAMDGDVGLFFRGRNEIAEEDIAS
jgi:hypothetical protein